MFVCVRCGARCAIQAGYCLRCGYPGTFVPVVVGPADAVLSDTPAAVVSMRELYRRSANFLDLGPEWVEVFGRWPAEPSITALYGPPGCGKTTTVTSLTAHLAERGLSPAIVNQLEQGTGPSYSELVRRLEIFRDDVLVCCTPNLGVLLDIVREHAPKLIVIDSLTVSTISAEDDRPGAGQLERPARGRPARPRRAAPAAGGGPHPVRGAAHPGRGRLLPGRRPRRRQLRRRPGVARGRARAPVDGPGVDDGDRRGRWRRALDPLLLAYRRQELNVAKLEHPRPARGIPRAGSFLASSP